MKKLLFILSYALSVMLAAGQYNPAQHTPFNKAVGIAQSVPTDARSYFYDPALFKYRPYQSVAEVNAYLNLSKYRVGNFPIFMHTGTLQSNGTFTGGGVTEYWYKDGTANANLVEKSAGGATSEIGYTTNQLAALSTAQNGVYTTIDRGGGKWKDIGLWDNIHVNDSALFMRSANNRTLQRMYESGKRPEWWGLNGVSDQNAINKAFGQEPGLVDLTAGQNYVTSAPIRMTRGQVLNGNKATITSTSTTNIIEGINELITGSYQHIGAGIYDVTLKSATAKNAINLKGFKTSIIQNPVIELTSADVNTVGVHFQHGTSGNEQCYFNSLNNASIFLDGPGTSILFSGSSASGANVNFVNGGIVSGYDRYAVRIKDNSVGNKIEGLDAEHWSVTADTAYLIESPLNTVITPHVENYATAFRVTGNGNKVQGLSSAVLNSQIIDEGGDNSFEGLTSGGTGTALSIGGNLDLGPYTKIRVAGDVFTSIRIDNKSSNPDSRNWALRSGFSGNDFDFTRSNLKGGDPVAAGTAMWSVNAQGHFVLPNQLKLVDITQYSTNTAAKNDGWANGFFYTTPDGIVRSIKSSVGGTHVETATDNDHAVRLDQMNAAIAGVAGGAGQFALAGSDIYNTNTGSVGLGTGTPVSKLDVRSSLAPAEITVGQANSTNGITALGFNNNTGRSYVNAPFGAFYFNVGTSGAVPAFIRPEGLVVGNSAVYSYVTPPLDGIYSEGEIRLAPATANDHAVTLGQMNTAINNTEFTLRNAVGAGFDLFYSPSANVGIIKQINFLGTNYPIATLSGDTVLNLDFSDFAHLSGTQTFTGQKTFSASTFFSGQPFITASLTTSTVQANYGVLTKDNSSGRVEVIPGASFLSSNAVLPEYSSNSVAVDNGLTNGQFYRTGDVVKQVHP